MSDSPKWHEFDKAGNKTVSIAAICLAIFLMTAVTSIRSCSIENKKAEAEEAVKSAAIKAESCLVEYTIVNNRQYVTKNWCGKDTEVPAEGVAIE